MKYINYRRHQKDSFNINEEPARIYHGTQKVNIDGNETDVPIIELKQIGEIREISFSIDHKKAKRLGWKGNGNIKKFLLDKELHDEVDEE